MTYFPNLNAGLHESIMAGIREMASQLPDAVERTQSEGFDFLSYPMKVAKDQLGTKHYSADKYAQIRADLGIEESDFRASMSQVEPPKLEKSGKSGSLFLHTQCKQYVVKQIVKKEMMQLEDMLLSYMHYLAENVLSLLPRILLAFSLRVGAHRYYFMVSNNVFASFSRSIRVYDLKGTTEDRFVRDSPEKPVLKDCNFIDHVLYFKKSDHEAVLTMIYRDSIFLRVHGLMDYSLLIGMSGSEDSESSELVTPCTNITPCFGAIHSKASDNSSKYGGNSLTEPISEFQSVRLGIIDILQGWTPKKVVAHCFKKPTLGIRREIDTEPPGRYQDRFYGYIAEKFLTMQTTHCRQYRTHLGIPLDPCEESPDVDELHITEV